MDATAAQVVNTLAVRDRSAAAYDAYFQVGLRPCSVTIYSVNFGLYVDDDISDFPSECKNIDLIDFYLKQ